MLVTRALVEEMAEEVRRRYKEEKRCGYADFSQIEFEVVTSYGFRGEKIREVRSLVSRRFSRDSKERNGNQPSAPRKSKSKERQQVLQKVEEKKEVKEKKLPLQMIFVFP